jgi:hypothetical protein
MNRTLLTSVALGSALLFAGCDKKDTPSPAPLAPAASATGASQPAGPAVYEKTVLSPVYEVDKIYKSMQGPQSTKELTLRDDAELELLWVVGFEAIIVEPKGTERVSQEFMCHTNLDIDPTLHQELFDDEDKRLTGRLFTLSQGQYRIDLPKGFGIPILSSELMSLNTQVLNLNIKEGKREVRHRVVMRYVRDSELDKPMKALFSAGAYGLKLLEGKDGRYGDDGDDGADEHAACLPGENAGQNEFGDGKGRRFTGHWVVKPGREENHTQVTKLMDLPWDTTLHYVAVHLHPYAESLELRDNTAGKAVFKAFTRQADEGIGLAHVDSLSSEEGIALFKDHAYELVSVYNNTSGEDQDSMAVMNLYALDKEFSKPDLAKAKARLAEERKKKADRSRPGQVGEHPHHHGAM